MDFLPKVLIRSVFILFFLLLPRSAFAVTVASQTQSFSDQLVTHRVLQELGNSLSGIAGSFTFRVSTAKSNLNQFNYTVQNSRIFDKDNSNSSIVACTPPGYDPNDPLGGLIFNTLGVPEGFEDVTLDFSCRDHTFIPGHRYLIVFASANYNEGSGLILLATAAYGPGGHGGSVDQFSGGGLRYSSGNKYDTANNGGSCSGIAYIWNDQNPTPSSGCNILTSPKDDLYFILKNTTPEPTPTPTPAPSKNPVIFIPGIGGSELKASQDIIWSKDDGHGGVFSHAYITNEKIWVNQDEAAKLGDDDYFDVLRLKADGEASEADLSLTGSLTSFGYGDIDSFFTGMGYEKGKNFFVFPYDWRKDVRTTKDNLDALVEEAKTKSGQTKVNIVAHSMGGLVARYYISDSGKAAKVNKLIELGVPHLGTVEGLKAIMYGKPVGRQILGDFYLGVPASEVKDIFQNFSSAFQLLPSKKFYDFYDNSSQKPFPFSDERDIDSNKTTGALNFTQVKELLENLKNNMTVFDFGEQFHDTLDSKFNQSTVVKLYNIAGTSQPTLGQIRETSLISWPINLIPIKDEVFINGDNTVPLYSASLKSDSLDITGGATIYFVEQKHSDLVAKDGPAMQAVKSILNEDSLPVEVKSEKIDLEGQQISLDDGELELYDDEGRHTGIKDDGEIEANIPETFYSTSGKTKHAFVKKKAKKVKVRATRKKKASSDPKTTNLKIRHYKQDKISKTTLYRDIPFTEVSKAEFTWDPAIDTSPSLTYYVDATKPDSTLITQTSEATGSAALDQTPPVTKIDLSGTKNSSGVYTSSVTVTLTGNDSDSGILKIEYSSDNGKTVNLYSEPFAVTTTGKTTLQVKSIDKLGNEEIPQEIVIEIAQSSSSSSGSNSSSTSQSTSSSSTSEEPVPVTSEVLRSDSSEVDKPSSSKDILGISFQNPAPSAQLTNSDFNNSANNELITENRRIDPLTSSIMIVILFMTQGGMVLLSSLGSAFTFFRPTPK